MEVLNKVFQITIALYGRTTIHYVTAQRASYAELTECNLSWVVEEEEEKTYALFSLKKE